MWRPASEDYMSLLTESSGELRVKQHRVWQVFAPHPPTPSPIIIKLQRQLHISMHSAGESRLNHARQEHGWFCPLFYG